MEKALEHQQAIQKERATTMKVNARYQAQRECVDILFGLAERFGDPQLALDAARYVLGLFDGAALKAPEKE